MNGADVQKENMARARKEEGFKDIVAVRTNVMPANEPRRFAVRMVIC